MIHRSKPVVADTVADEVPEVTNKEDGGQTSKSMDKKPAQKHSNRASSGTQDGPVCYDRTSLLMVVRTSIPRTISPFTAFRGQAKCSS